jgi:hypothetical protein
MQTFLPYEDFEESAKVLDHYNAGRYSRCWKQVVEAKQILCQLRADNLPEDWKQTKDYIKQGWKHHPAVKMWEGSEELLKLYYNVFLRICKDVHGVNTVQVRLEIDNSKIRTPWWYGNDDFHRAMRARLIEKDSEYYGKLFPEDRGFNQGLYLWPVEGKHEFKTIKN